MNIEKYSGRSRGFIQSAQTAALGKGHQQFSPVHLLKVLLDDDQGMASGLIERAGGDAKAVRAGVEAALNKIPKVSGDAGQLYLGRELARVFDTAEQAAQHRHELRPVQQGDCGNRAGLNHHGVGVGRKLEGERFARWIFSRCAR